MTRRLPLVLCLVAVAAASAQAGPSIDIALRESKLLLVDEAHAVVLGQGSDGNLVGVDLAQGKVAWRANVGAEPGEAFLVGERLFFAGARGAQSVHLRTGERAVVPNVSGVVLRAGDGVLAHDASDVRRVALDGTVAWTFSSGGRIQALAPTADGAVVLLADALVHVDVTGAAAWRAPRPEGLPRDPRLAVIGGDAWLIGGRNLWAFSLADGAPRGPLELAEASGRAEVSFELQGAPHVAGETVLLAGRVSRSTSTASGGFTSTEDGLNVLVDSRRFRIVFRLTGELEVFGPDALLLQVWVENRAQPHMPSTVGVAYDLKGKKLWQLPFVPEMSLTHYAVLDIAEAKPPHGLVVRDLRRGRQVAFVPIPEEHLRASEQRLRQGDLSAVGEFGEGLLHGGIGFFVRSHDLVRAIRGDALRGPYPEVKLPGGTGRLGAVGLTPRGRLVILVEDGPLVLGAAP